MNQTIQDTGQPVRLGKPRLPKQAGLLHSAVDLVHFMPNHLFGLPVI